VLIVLDRAWLSHLMNLAEGGNLGAVALQQSLPDEVAVHKVGDHDRPALAVAALAMSMLVY